MPTCRRANVEPWVTGQPGLTNLRLSASASWTPCLESISRIRILAPTNSTLPTNRYAAVPCHVQESFASGHDVVIGGALRQLQSRAFIQSHQRTTCETLQTELLAVATCVQDPEYVMHLGQNSCRS